jgi:hypothetical protein
VGCGRGDLYFVSVGLHDFYAIDLVKEETALKERDLLLNSHFAPFGICVCNFVWSFSLTKAGRVKVLSEEMG